LFKRGFGLRRTNPGESRSLAAGNLIVIMGGQGWLAGQFFGMF
jgi:hypothetical protein